jgi:hypothetical protein
MFLAPLDLALATGFSDHWYERSTEGPYLRLDLRFDPGLRWQRGRLLIHLPTRFAHRETFGETLRQTDAASGVETLWRPAAGWRLGVDGGVHRRWRPDWPDLYQPTFDETGRPDGLAPTDRGGWLEWTTGARAEADSSVGRFSLDGRFRRRLGVVDPAYDPVLTPTHLPPADRDVVTTAFGLRGTFLDGRLRHRHALSGERAVFPTLPARDAGTGKTHAGPGGDPPNPDFVLWHAGATTAWRARLGFLGSKVEGRLGYRRSLDAFDGYYTADTFSAGAGLSLRPGLGLRLSVDYDGRWRRYGPDAYAAGPDHPPLDGGAARRLGTRHAVAAEVSRPFSRRRLIPFLSVRWVDVETNFPDYVPFENPVGSAYDIDWDYRWTTVEVGLRVRL